MNAKTFKRFDSALTALRVLMAIIIALSFFLNAVDSARAASPDRPSASQPGDGIDGLKNAMKTLAKAVLSLLMIAASILLTIGIATGAVSGMFGATAGSPYVLAQSWFKIISIVILAVVAFASPLIASTVIDTIAGLGGGDIPMFGG